MKALYIAYYTALRNIRDYRNLSTMLALPIVTIFILGSALSGSFKIENIDPVKAVLVDESSGELSAGLESFLLSPDIKEIMEIDRADDFNEGMNRVKQGKALSLIHVEKGFAGEIKVYKSNSNPFKDSVVQNVLDSFVQSANAEYAYAKLGSKASDAHFSQSIREEAVNTDGKLPSALDYYAVSMLIMTMMYGTTYGCAAMSEERFYKTEIRLKSAPVASYEIYAGKVAGTILTLMLDGAVIILFTKYAYNVNWGSRIPVILFACLSLSVLAAGLGIAGFMLIGDANKTQALLSIMVPVFTFLGGGYIPVQYMSPEMEKLSFLSPNHIGQRIILNSIFEGNAVQTRSYLLILWAASLLMFALSAFKGRRDLD